MYPTKCTHTIASIYTLAVTSVVYAGAATVAFARPTIATNMASATGIVMFIAAVMSVIRIRDIHSRPLQYTIAPPYTSFQHAKYYVAIGIVVFMMMLSLFVVLGGVPECKYNIQTQEFEHYGVNHSTKTPISAFMFWIVTICQFITYGCWILFFHVSAKEYIREKCRGQSKGDNAKESK